MVVIVGFLTLSMAALVVDLGIALPGDDSTLLAELARQVTGGGPLFAAFQAASALLLLAAAASSYLAGSGLLKALALLGDEARGLLPARFARTNRFLVPPWGIAVILLASALLVIGARGKEQDLVHFYAVSVFASFLAATLGCARLSVRDGRRTAAALNLAGAALVALVLTLNLTRLDSAIALGASGLLAIYLWSAWVRRGRPSGLARLER
jgi:hypothetical protein